MPETGIGLPSTDDAMNKVAPKEGDDTPTGAKDMYSEDQRKEDAKALKKARADERKIIERAVKRFKRAQDAEADNRKKALEDLEFKAGKQWPSDVEADRTQKKRPCLTINGLPTLTHQISNDIRQNRPAINVSPLGDDATKESGEMYASFIRAIERDSAADIAYDTGTGSAVDIGFGYWRILTEFDEPDSLDQVIVFRRVRNSFTVLLDEQRQEPDGCDARYGFVSEMIDRADFEDKYPDARPVSWKESGVGEAFKEWVTKDQIRVAEYFEVTHEMKRVVRLDNGHVGYYEDLDESVKKKIVGGSVKIVDERDSEVQLVDWYKLTAAEILDRHPWPGKWIPIVEIIGEEIDLAGKVIRSGIIRNAKDPMRMKNFAATAKAESVAQVPKTPWVAPEGSFEGHEDEWDRAVNENVARLEYMQQYSEQGQALPAPTRQPPAGIPAGWVEIEKGAEQDLMRTTGVRFDASTSERLYDESGKAIKELRRNTDVGSFHFADNMSRSLRHTGRILLDLIPKVYNRKRMVPSVGEDGKESRIMIDPSHNKPTGRLEPKNRNEEPIKVFNPALGKYGVTITIGPSYATKRIEAQEQLSQFIGKLPEPMRGVAAALTAKYSDWPGSTELFKALAQMLPPGILGIELGNLPPEAQAMIKSLQQQLQQGQMEKKQMLMELGDKRTDQALIKSKIDKDFEAKILKLFADMKKAAAKNDMDSLKTLLGAAETVKGLLGLDRSPEGQSPGKTATSPSASSNVIPMGVA